MYIITVTDEDGTTTYRHRTIHATVRRLVDLGPCDVECVYRRAGHADVTVWLDAPTSAAWDRGEVTLYQNDASGLAVPHMRYKSNDEA